MHKMSANWGGSAFLFCYKSLLRNYSRNFY